MLPLPGKHHGFAVVLVLVSGNCMVTNLEKYLLISRLHVPDVRISISFILGAAFFDFRDNTKCTSHVTSCQFHAIR